MVNNVINEIVIGIATKITKIYEDKGKYPIYTDNVKQGLEKPCFFIKYLNGEEKREIGLENRFYRDTLNFVIIGHTLDGDTEILNDMIDNLYDLEYIELTDKTLLRAHKLHPKIEDGVLHFFIDYEIFIKKENATTTKMDNYDLSGEVKKDENI